MFLILVFAEAASEVHRERKSRHQRQDGAAAVADHRQRQTDYRQDAAHHADVDKDVDKEGQQDARHHDAGKAVGEVQREVEAARDDEAVADEEDADTDEAGFFCDNGEDEVGAGFGQEFEL